MLDSGVINLRNVEGSPCHHRDHRRARKPAEVAGTYAVSRSWVYELLARYRAEGEAAFQPRSRRPRSSPRAIPDATVELIVGLRKDLAGRGLDAGPATRTGTILVPARM